MSPRAKTPEAGKKKTAKKIKASISKSMPVSDIIGMLPEAGPLLAEYGLHCFGCAFNAIETLEQGCVGHGFMDTDIDDLVKDLNQLLADRSERPQILTLTRDAALGLKNIAEEQGKLEEALIVSTDEDGAFCLEFHPKPGTDDRVFLNREVPELRIFASSVTLERIGGATIDLREGRFKLDMPTIIACACGKGECTCGKGECGCGGNCQCKN